jgi:hypothetical protein
MNNWQMKYAAMVLSAMLSYAAYQWIPWEEMGAAEWASWVQAIGSIGAIIGAYYFGERQAQAAVRSAFEIDALSEVKRQKSYFEIVAAACDYANRISKHFSSDWVNKIGITLEYDEQIAASLIDAISAVPIHDLGTDERVRAWIDTKIALVYFQNAMVAYMAEINDDDGRGEEDPPGHRSRVIQCGQHVKTCYGRLGPLILVQNKRVFLHRR